MNAMLARRRPVMTAALAWALLCLSSAALALNPTLDISQYSHTAWRMRDGFWNAELTAIARTPDGYLWLGTAAGLLRFDGVRAVAWRPEGNQALPSSWITGLLATDDGTLWVGTDKGLANLREGVVRHYGELDGQRIGRMEMTRDRHLWFTVAGATGGWELCALENDTAHCDANDQPAKSVVGLHADAQGTLWAGTLEGLWRWRPAPPLFYALSDLNGIQCFAAGNNGELLLGIRGRLTALRDRRMETAWLFPRQMRNAQCASLLRDRDGGLWIGTSEGLVHVHDHFTDSFTEANGLSGDYVRAFLEDREGSIWVVTREGLDRFRTPAAAIVSMPQGLSNPNVTSALAAMDGSVWIGTYNGLTRFHGNEATVYRDAGLPATDETARDPSRAVQTVRTSDLALGGITALFEDHLRRVWVAMRGGVSRFEDGQFFRVSGLAADYTRSIAEDSESVWVDDDRSGLYRLTTEGDVVQHLSWTELERPTPATAAAADRSKRGIWLGFAEGHIGYLVDGRIRESYGAAEGFGPGYVRNLYLSANDVWAATDAGLRRVHEGRVSTLSQENGLPCNTAQWLVDDRHSFWLGMSCGLVQIDRMEIDRWTRFADQGNEAAPVRMRVFGTADGVRQHPVAAFSTAPAVVAADGRLWFVTPAGAGVIDPQHLPFNSLPPPVHIEQLTADRQVYAVSANGAARLSLPPRTRSLQIEYTALSLVAPEKMQFRYQLEGWDREWQNVGTRRQAFYDNLPPGNYRFHVAASNNDGVWNEEGATLALAIAPAYYQTTWFLALAAGLVVAAAWAGHRIRLRVVERHQGEITALNERLMKAQEQERMRIAGELHDGVMQEMVAATMLLGSAKRWITDDSRAKPTIEKVQQKLVQVGTDIRQLSHELHPPMLQRAGLSEALESYCEEFRATSGLAITCDADKTVAALSRGSALALYRIVQEALGNSLKHAHATQIHVRLTRSADHVTLAVTDDGAGFDPSRPGAGGGLGLVTMRERAAQLNGTFEFESAPGRGTTIRATIPFR